LKPPLRLGVMQWPGFGFDPADIYYVS